MGMVKHGTGEILREEGDVDRGQGDRSDSTQEPEQTREQTEDRGEK